MSKKGQPEFIDNYKQYISGKEPLKFATRIQNDEIFKMIKSSIKKRFWILPKLYEDGAASAAAADTNISNVPINPTPATRNSIGTADFPPSNRAKKPKKVKKITNSALNFSSFCKKDQ